MDYPRQTDKHTDIGTPSVAIATENKHKKLKYSATPWKIHSAGNFYEFKTLRIAFFVTLLIKSSAQLLFIN